VHLIETLLEMQRFWIETAEIPTTQEFLIHIENAVNIKKTLWYDLKKFKNFIEEYPRFLDANISFTEIIKKMPSFKKWLKSKKARDLDVEDVCSEAYWKKNDLLLANSAELE
jgi:hypothetical protein